MTNRKREIFILLFYFLYCMVSQSFDASRGTRDALDAPFIGEQMFSHSKFPFLEPQRGVFKTSRLFSSHPSARKIIRDGSVNFPKRAGDETISKARYSYSSFIKSSAAYNLA